MTIVYEKILDDITSNVRYVVKEFKKPEEAGVYVEQRLEALVRQGYTYEIPSKNGEVECYSEKARKFRVFAIAEKQRFVTKKEYEARLALEAESEKSIQELLKSIGWDWETISRKKV